MCVTPTRVTEEVIEEGSVDWAYLHSGAEGLQYLHEEEDVELSPSCIVYDDTWLHADYESLGAIAIEGQCAMREGH